MPNKLHFYTKYSKEKIKITAKPFASGGEGAIYAIASPRTYSHLVAKIYYPEKRTDERERKMNYLIQYPPVEFQKGMHSSIGWVQDLIYKDKRFIGIVIQRIKGKKLTKLTLNKLPRRADKAWKRFAFGQPDALKLRLHTCFNLAVVIRQIHANERYVLVDLKPDNVLMQPNGLIAVVDMDSVEVIENGKAIFSAPVATPEYTPPEYYQDKKLDPIEETWDRFSLGVIFYQLLFGLHPFAAACKHPYDHLVGLNDKIQHGFYVHNKAKKALFKVIPPPHQQFYKTPLELQQLFQACFEAGGTAPEIRPTAADWCEVFAKLLNIPFQKQPKLTPPPSDLYFSPAKYAKDKNFVYPSFKKTIPEIDNLIAPKKTALNVDSGMFDQLLKESYQEQIRYDRTSFFTYITLISSIVLMLLQALPFPLLIGMSFILLIFSYFLFGSPKKTINNVGKKILSKHTYELLGIKSYESIDNDKVNFTLKLIQQLIQREKLELKEQTRNIEKICDGMNPQNLSFIQQYFKRQEDLDQKVKTFNTWVVDAEREIMSARETELTGYKEAVTSFQEQLQEDSRYKNYSFKSYRNLKISLEHTIKVQENNLEKVRYNVLNVVEDAHKQKIKKLQIDASKEIEAYKKEQEAIAQFAIKKYSDVVTKSNRESIDYQSFLKKSNALKKRLQRDKKKIYTKQLKDLESTTKQLGFKSVKELERQVKFLDNIPEIKQLNVLQIQLQETFKTLAQQIISLNLKSPHIQIILDELQQEIPLISNLQPNTKSRDLNELSNNMEHIHQAIELTTEQLTLKIQTFCSDTSAHNYSIELAYWIKETKDLIDSIRFNLENHTNVQEQFYGDPVVFKLRLNYRKKLDQIKAHSQEKENTYHKEINQLKEIYKDAIQYNEHKKQIEKQRKALILAKEKEVTTQKEKKIALFEKNGTEKLNKKIQLVKIEQEKELRKLEEEVLQKKKKINQLITQTTTDLKHLDSDYQNFSQKLDAIKTGAESIYSTHKLLANSQSDAIEQLIQQTLKEYPKIDPLLKEYKSVNELLIKKETIYKTNLNDFKQLKAEKIRLDTLLEWQKNYDPKIYIKDLLLNKVELFEKKSVAKKK